MPLAPLVDCSAHDPAYGITCYKRPEWVVLSPTNGTTTKHACTLHLGKVVEGVYTPGDLIVVSAYEGA